MPRPNKKATQSIWAILGVPANVAYKESAKDRKIKDALAAQESKLLR